MKRLALLVVALVVVVTAALGFQALRVNDEYGQWRLTPTVPPLRIQTLGREYKRSELEPATKVPSGFEPAGKADDVGGTVLAPSGLNGRVPVVIYFVDDDGRVCSYALVGGP